MTSPKNALDRVSWDFSGSTTPPGSLHSLHFYPTNILPQIPTHLIQILSKPGDVILDPFCGTGTVGVEAIMLGRTAWQNDVSRAALQVAKGKFVLARSLVSGDLLDRIAESLLFDGLSRSDEIGALGEGNHSELDRWFAPQTLTQLRFLWKLIESQPSRVREALEMIFSDTLFACASTAASKTRTGKTRKHHWGWIADNVRPKSLAIHNAIDFFRTRLTNAAMAVRSLPPLPSRIDSADRLMQTDSRALSLPESTVDLVVTSPPYLGMTDFVYANRLTYLWMNWPLSEDFGAEIGSRRHRNRRFAEAEYLHDMREAWTRIRTAIRPGGYCAVVIGASRKFPEAEGSYFDLMAELGFQRIWGPTPRSPSRRRVAARGSATSREYVCVWRK